MAAITKLPKTRAQKAAATKAANIAKRRAALFAVAPELALPPHVVIARREAKERAAKARERKIKKIKALAADTRGNEHVRASAAAKLASWYCGCNDVFLKTTTKINPPR